ncbi:MAG: hypothetical protein KAR13_04570 [Desulfobulbaceae bacterium]|nr:hypothetical protein [Desulfobulbaceae bacterium]
MKKKHCRGKITGVFFAILMGMMTNSLSFAGIDDGLVAYYPFNGNANDASGNVNHGTVHGATLIEDRFGNSNSAYSFDGNNDYIITNYTPSQNLGTNFSISSWIKWNGSTGNHQRIVTKWQEGNIGSHEYSLFLYGGSNKIRLSVGSGKIQSEFVPTLDTWHFVTATSNNSFAKIFIDGSLVFEKSYSTSIVYDQEPLIIGGGGTQYSMPRYIFNGVLDDIRIYNRALSDSEISELYNHPVADAGPDQIVCNEICSGAVLDGRKSYDPNGEIVSYLWQIQHRENSLYDRDASGETPTLFDLNPGVYDVKLTVEDDDNLTDSDAMVLKVLDTCNPCSIMKGDLDGDGDVDGNDLSIFSQNYGTIPLTPSQDINQRYFEMLLSQARIGDILLFSACDGDIDEPLNCTAHVIEDVIAGLTGWSIDGLIGYGFFQHAALIYQKENDGITILHGRGPSHGVGTDHIDTSKMNQWKSIMLLRVHNFNDNDALWVANNAYSRWDNTVYDSLFLPYNGQVYCSELIWDAYKIGVKSHFDLTLISLL